MRLIAGIMMVSGITTAYALTPDQMDAAVQAVRAVAGDARVLDVDVEGMGADPVVNIEMSNGQEYYVQTGTGTILREKPEQLDQSDRRLLTRLDDESAPSLEAVYRKMVAALELDSRFTSLGEYRLDSIDYDIEGGQIVLDAEFRIVGTGQEISVYADAFTGDIITMEFDD